MADFIIQTKCEKCGNDVKAVVDIDPVSIFKKVRCGRKPDGVIPVYRINSDEIANYVIEKSRQFVPDIKMEIIPKYIEKKRQKPNEPHRSYCSFRIGMSDASTEKKTNYGWFGQVGRSNGEIKFVQSLYDYVIRKYRFNPKNVELWSSDYKIMEQLENNFGITEEYIGILKDYITPIMAPANDGSEWVLWAAAAENIICDMLETVDTGMVDGTIQIVDTYPISKNLIEFLVYVQPAQASLKENPYVRQLLLGDIKSKAKNK